MIFSGVRCQVLRRIVRELKCHQRQLRERHYWNNMECSDLQPPNSVRGMLTLNREAFQKRVQIPRLLVPLDRVIGVKAIVKTLLLKMHQLVPIRNVEDPKRALQTENMDSKEFKEILLHPVPVKSWESLPTEQLEKLNINESNFYYDELELNYDNWRADEILKSILPLEGDALTSFSRIGHIVHLNLRDHLLPYKTLIGEVFCDKLVGCRTVVNKVSSINNSYRNFQLELISGVPEYEVETKENGVAFNFDFSSVYWNPRLSTEHERIVKMLNAGDVLYDVFAGVGPFSVPAARKKCVVLANDLNPESFRWLTHNMKRNKCLKNVQLFNMDGRDFILQHVRTDLLKRLNSLNDSNESETTSYTMHITMNLPALAVEFLDAFRGLFTCDELENRGVQMNFPIVHVYTFVRGDDPKSIACKLVENHLGLPLENNLVSVNFVRNVAPNKDMYRISFRLSEKMLTSSKTAAVDNENQENTVIISESRKRLATNELPENKESLSIKTKRV